MEDWVGILVGMEGFPIGMAINTGHTITLSVQGSDLAIMIGMLMLVVCIMVLV